MNVFPLLPVMPLMPVLIALQACTVCALRPPLKPPMAHTCRTNTMSLTVNNIYPIFKSTTPVRYKDKDSHKINVWFRRLLLEWEDNNNREKVNNIRWWQRQSTGRWWQRKGWAPAPALELTTRSGHNYSPVYRIDPYLLINQRQWYELTIRAAIK